MRISELLATQRPFFSFEFFPPKDGEASRRLFETIEALAPLRPAFVSITYGAGGSTRTRTVELATQIQRDTGIAVMAHATCIGATRAELRELFDELARAGIQNVLALRGDPPSDGAPTPAGGFSHANELVEMIARDYDFGIGAACHPEKHLEAPSIEVDIEHTKRKVDAGAQFLVSQLFFDNDAYFDFVDRARRAGIDVPILPGIMPITNYEQIDRFTAKCGASIPPKLRVELETRRGDSPAVENLGVAYASVQCVDLLARGAPGIHFYTLNKSPATKSIVSALLASSAWRPAFGRDLVR
jgi:methylenetetrahydrofolate reductase (NADPH)